MEGKNENSNRQVVDFEQRPEDLPAMDRWPVLRRIWDKLNARTEPTDIEQKWEKRISPKHVAVLAVALVAWVVYLLMQPVDQIETRTASKSPAAAWNPNKCRITEDTLATVTEANYEKIISMVRANDREALVRMVALNYAVSLAQGTEVQLLEDSSIAKVRPIGTTVELYLGDSFVNCYQ